MQQTFFQLDESQG